MVAQWTNALTGPVDPDAPEEPGGGRDPPSSLTFDLDVGMTVEECQVSK